MKPAPSRSDSEKAMRLIHVRLKAETHKRLRIRAAEGDVSIQDWVEGLIERELNVTETDNARRTVRG